MRLAAIVTAACIACAAGEEHLVGNVALGYTYGLAGAVSVDGQSHDWDESARYALIMRDYFFRDQDTHPFSELTLFLDEASVEERGVEVSTSTFAIGVAIGAAIPLWRAPGSDIAFGIAPYLGMQAGRLSVDVRQDPSHHSDDDCFRWGFDGGVDLGMLINQTISVTLGCAGTYWRAYDADVSVIDGGGNERGIEDDLSGWDLGARLTVGVCF